MRSSRTPDAIRPIRDNSYKYSSNLELSIDANDDDGDGNGEQAKGPTGGVQAKGPTVHDDDDGNGKLSRAVEPGVEQSDDADIQCEESNEAASGIRVVRSPGTPSQKEREEHSVNHWPYRSWCDHCVRGRASGQPHKTVKG